MVVKFVAITNIILDFKRCIQISQAIIDNECYSPKILNDSLSYAISLLNNTLIIYQICRYLLLGFFFFGFLNLVFFSNYGMANTVNTWREKENRRKLRNEERTIIDSIHILSQ